MTGVHAGFLIMKRSVSVLLHDATIVLKHNFIIIFFFWSLLSVLQIVNVHNIESLSVADKIIHLQNHANCLHVYRQNYVHMLVCTQIFA